MDKSNQGLEEGLPGKQILSILKNQKLDLYRKQVNRLVTELEVDVLDYAAALVCFIEQESNLSTNVLHGNKKTHRKQMPVEILFNIRMVRYRMEVGRKHQVSVDDIKRVLIEESGVEKSCIGQIDLHFNYCIVSLPSGMPADIFFHLKKVCINEHGLKISRLGGRSGNFRKKSKQRGGRRNFHNMNNNPLKQEK